MYTGIRGGHSKASPGAADILNELTEDRIIYPKVIDFLKSYGHNTIDLTPPESYSYPSELTYGINLANQKGIELGASIHLNAGGGHGCEVIIHDQAKQSTVDRANRVLDNLSALGFYNRGIKRSPSSRYLGEIVDTNCSFLIIEVCFVDSQEDADLLHKVGYDAIARAIAQGLNLSNVITPMPTKAPVQSVQAQPQVVKQEEGYMSKKYQNGSTPEPVYADENFNYKIGSLDPHESCEAIADYNNKIVVMYNTPNGKKAGFVKYRGGL